MQIVRNYGAKMDAPSVAIMESQLFPVCHLTAFCTVCFFAAIHKYTHSTCMKAFLIFIISFVRQSHEQPNVVCHRRRVGVVVCTIYLVCSSRTPPYQMRSTIFRVSFAPLPFLFSLTLVLFYIGFRSVPFRVGFWCFVAVSIHLFSSYIR